jgi:tetratricopeptide (TPR) repeat protein
MSAAPILSGWHAGLVLLAISTSMCANAQMDGGRPQYTPASWALLPTWCIDTQDNYGSPNWSSEYPDGRNASPLSDHWTSIFGKDFWHMHHYCRALFLLQGVEMSAQSPTIKLGTIERAIADLGYVIKYCKESNPLMPEFFYRLGEAELRRNNLINAMDAFANARRIKPEYWPAYTRWADELAKLRKYDTASALIDEGLKYSPDEEELRKRKSSIERQRAKRVLPASKSPFPH